MKIKNLFISEDALNFPLTKEIIKNRKYIITTIEEIRELSAEKKINRRDTLFLTTFPANFIKDCPCTPGYVSCGYKNINIAYNCSVDCSYCILQDYLTYPVLTLFVNMEKLENELDELSKRKSYLRIGTGELTDSLIWEKLYPLSNSFNELFRKKEDIIFEYKTKTNYIENFKKNRNNNILISFSMNPPTLKREEPFAASPRKRIEAMEYLIKLGYPIGIHFDPLIYYEQWEDDYKILIKNIFAKIPPSNIGWISLGSLRFHKNMRWIIRDNHKNSILLKTEFVEGSDNKYRYPYTTRYKLYKTIIKYLRDFGSNHLPIYFCMENRQIWEELLPVRPETEIINKYLYESVKHFYSGKQTNY
jgi:spore photoproduct lyase